MSLRFPSQVQERLGYVSFDVVGSEDAEVNARAEGTDLEQAKKNIKKEAEEQGEPSKLQEFFDDAKEVYNDVKGGIEAVDDALGAVEGFLGDAGGKLDGILQDFFGVEPEFQPFVRGKMDLEDPKNQVVLYLPPGFQVAEGVAFDGVDLGATGALAMNTMTKDNIDDYLSGTAAIVKDVASSLTDMLKGSGNPEAARLAAIQAAGVTRRLAGSGVAAAGNVAAGVTIAPNQRTLFKRVNMREFSFSFSLVPSSAEEASTVDSIVDFFRHFLYPEPIMVGDIRVGYKYPGNPNRIIKTSVFGKISVK